VPHPAGPEFAAAGGSIVRTAVHDPLFLYFLFLIFLTLISLIISISYFLFLFLTRFQASMGGRRRARQIAKIASERDRALRAHWFNRSPMVHRSPKSIRRGYGLGLQPGAENAAWNSTSCLKS
jgi:hypothetical protein